MVYTDLNHADEGIKLLRMLRQINDDALRGRLTGLLAEIGILNKLLAADKSMHELRSELVHIARDLAFDEQGHLSINLASWRQYVALSLT